MPVDPPSWAPSVLDVAQLLLSRTEVDEGTGTRTFTADTVPDLETVQGKIADAVGELDDYLGRPVPETWADDAQRLAARRAAAMIEASVSPELIHTDESPYRPYQAMYLDGSKRLAAKLRPGIRIQ